MAIGGRQILKGILALAAVVVLMLLIGKWQEGNARGGQNPADPFVVAGNLHFVGASDVASFLLTGPEGHILIDGGYPLQPPLILESIRKLGFDPRDVKLILVSEAHHDHAGGLADLQQATGAKIVASDLTAEWLEEGGGEEATAHPAFRIVEALGQMSYAPVRVDRHVKDRDTVRLGPVAVTAHLTPGHTRGCTSWSFPVREGDRELLAVSACSMELLNGIRVVEPERYPGIRADLERTFATLRSLPADVWVTNHGRAFGRYRKYSARKAAKDSANPFIDPDGYRAFIDSGEARFRRRLAEQQAEAAKSRQ
jgi:metallo-beta-lactamase class B